MLAEGMSLTALALAGYIGWTAMLLLVLIGHRSSVVLKGDKAANQFSSSGDDVSALGLRLTRAHANCVESFPIVGGVLLLALVTEQQALIEPLAMGLLLARLIQSTIHIVSTSVLAVQLRLLAFLMQIGMCLYGLYLLVV